MSRVFRTKRMRITAWLLSAAVFMGSMDVNMLIVQAAQEEELYTQDDSEMAGAQILTDELPEAYGEESATKQQTESATDNAENPENISNTEKTDYAEDADAPVNEEMVMTAADMPAAQADGDEEPAGPVTVTITGVAVQNKTYDGTAGAVNGLKAIVPKEVSASKKDEDVTSQVTFQYTISGTKKDGDPYSENGSTSDGSIRDGMPKDAGDYTLTVRVEDVNGKYMGLQSCSFVITQRPITIKPKDITRKIGDAKPVLDKPGDYMIVGTMVSGETIGTQPTIECDVEPDTDGKLTKPGIYTISASGADAGPNYIISYQEGTLTVSEKEEVKITGVTVTDKTYDGEPVSRAACGLQETADTIGSQIKVTDTDGKDITGEVELNLSISGRQNNGESYYFSTNKVNTITESGDAQADDTEPQNGMPVNAGEYALTITVTATKYRGIYKKEFSINRRPVTLKADDMEIKQDAKVPEQSDFTYTTDGLLGDDEITKQPIFDCDITSTEKTGEYSITPRRASAGGNYVISYLPGTLKVLEKDRITISGVTIPVKVYDGKPSVCSKDNLKVVLNQVDKPSKDITNQVTVTYDISGTTEAGKAYSSSSIETGMPTEAGEYTLTVNVASEPDDESGNKYQGWQEWSFRISKRPIIIKVKDMEIRTEDEIPAPSEYMYDPNDMGMGFIGDDTFINEPVFTCDIQNTDRVGTYDIIASDADAGSNYSITYQSGTLTVVEKEVEKTRRLLRIIPPVPVVNVENGTTLDKMPLPETVEIVTRDFNAVVDKEDSSLSEDNEKAGVIWERKPIDGTSYSLSNEGEQTFTIGGTVVLPADVDEEEVSLAVKVQVSVREKWSFRDTVAAPVASIPGGSAVRRGTTVRLSCETEGAQIYYTLDDKKPDRTSNLYTTPIEINGFTVIWAYAHKEGQPDSETVKYYYYIGSPDGEGDEPEVPEEDIPEDGIIPEGLWITKVSEYTYTGKAIKPEVRVYDYKTRLEEKKDYTISYANNTKAADQNAEKAPSIIITGKGNYEGKLTKRFTILPKDIRNSDVSVDDIAVAYNKNKSQKPVPSVLWNGKKLAAKKDYIVQDVSYKEAGTYPVTVTGIGNYMGEKTFKFTITEGVLVSKLTISKIPNQTYTGKEIIPEFTVKYKGKELTRDEDYAVVRYENNKNVGTATIVIEGRGGYAGTRKITFKIVEIASLAKAKAELKFVNTPTYTGKEIRADQEIVTITLKENGESVIRTLERGTDYEVTYTNNVKVGTATANFTGKGAYSGKLKKTFKIVACDINKAKITLNKSYSYEKGGCKPEPVVTFGGKTLKAGTDYTLTYKQNNTAGIRAVLTVKGKGNFKESKSIEYDVTQQDIGKMTIAAADKVYQNKKNIYMTTVQVTDVNGKRLVAGKDYNKNMEYTYAERTLIDRTYKKAGEPVGKDDIIPAGTKINVTVTANGADYSGTLTGTYRIVTANISKAKVTIPVQSYTGKEIKPDTQIRVEIQGTVLKPEEYEVVGYSNNINKGTAKVVIHGLGNYGGTKTATFKIKGKGLFNF